MIGRMCLPTRRDVLIASGSSLAWLSGCLNTGPTDEDARTRATDANGTNSTTRTMADNSNDEREHPGTDREADESIRCSVSGEVVTDVPSDVPVVASSTVNISETPVLERVFDAANSADADTTTVQRPSGEYEKVTVTPDSVAEEDAAREELQRHPQYDNPDYPAGVYIDDGDLTLAVYMVCLT